jgi:hypothetical protein
MLRQLKRLAAIVPLTLSSLALSHSAPGASLDRVQAARSDDFVAFVGVNTHVNWTGTIWESRADEWRRALGDLGVRAIRTDLSRDLFVRDTLLALHEQYGIQSNVIVQPRHPDGTLDTARVASLLRFLRNQIGAEKILAIESPNEYNSTANEGNSDWDAELSSFHAELYASVKADPRLTNTPVIGPSVYRRISDDYVRLSAWNLEADYGNLHYYTGGFKPTVHIHDRRERHLDAAIAEAQTVIPGRPVFITEAGFDASDTPAPFKVSTQAAAKYLVRLISEAFIRRDHVAGVFIYSLIDDHDNGFGLLRHDLTRKPSFYALRNVLSLLSDPGELFEPASLRFSMSGDMQDVRSILLQRRDGRFYLLVWHDANSFDRVSLSDISVAERKVVLDLSAEFVSLVNIYDPLSAEHAEDAGVPKPFMSLSEPSVVPLAVPDHVLIVEIVLGHR